MPRLFWIDTETTGLDADIHAMIQAAIIVDIDGKIELQESYNIAPCKGAEIDPAALEVNGINEKDMADYSSLWMFVGKIIDIGQHFVRDGHEAEDRLIMAGWNIPFDMKFLFAGFDWILGYETARVLVDKMFLPPALDVRILALAKLINRRKLMQSFSLVKVAEELGLDWCGKPHDALANIQMTRLIYTHLMGG